MAKQRHESRKGVKSKAGEAPLRRQAADDDTHVTALGLKAAPPSDAMAAYFNKCEEKLGFVPNVLKAYAFDMGKL
ncbi:MAG TPA: alkylhydroperoxidase, partial [Xanthobacteraceae bacterium]|nr:alkylhydroperoxidase [Xanthobacteraceae bacterium]